MRLSSLADYAVLMMRTAATHCGGARANATTLAQEAGIPVPTAQKLASLLGRAGLIKRRLDLESPHQPRNCQPSPLLRKRLS